MGRVDARILDEAAQWLARCHASDFSTAERDSLARWREQSPVHEDVWQRAQQLKFQLEAVPSSVGMAVLNRSRSSAGRRSLLRGTTLVLTPLLGWLAYRQLPWQIWGAEYRTAHGELRSVTLADGSRLVLNTASAVNVRMDDSARLVHQHAGEILVETSHRGAHTDLPFIVRTGHGELQALGTKFIVRTQEQSTALSVLEGAVRITPANTGRGLVVRAGERVSFNAQNIGEVAPLAPHADAWTEGVLYAENMRLKDFLAEVARYRDGVLHCAPDVAELRISGVFQLRDTDRVLVLMAQTLPVRVEQRTRFWATVVRS
ncbi:DUF4880 domain-containing protein [Diaphorobacter sp. HDW4A]|uniref:FecR domain-containing protein n=1 Tax=Diaphorobacter sp. HDW4A TaxID=2714924 RepID=UPI0014088330|nr:FecR domain-containing protein [Diaphorobacter sp. HDW4A]QIL79578.1 DUF4880 domain-containing protein [Diaphorobacter sp. HDW4A]